ncbi:MAG TPA: hypothetical protein VGV59_12265 [Pyrinomonadaceae bacterium]|nr:hypothetical protein [Pyrinomonadaceae bacterium]
MSRETRAAAAAADCAATPEEERPSAPPIRRGITWDADFYRGAKRQRPAAGRPVAEQPREGFDAAQQHDEREG